jgi:Transposase DDE domain
MQLPLTDPDTLFEELLQDLPAETVQMARAFKALVRAKKVKTPVQLLRVVFLYCGLDKPLREVAGTFTVLYESITDQSVAERMRACGPWVQALLRQMLPMAAVESLPTGRRFVVIDASSIQAPGATGTDHRLHIAMDLLSLQFLEVLVSDAHTGETLKHFTLAPGDVVVADRGYAQCQGMRVAIEQGAALIVRLNPFSVVLGDAAGAPLALSAAWKRQKMETLRTLEVALHAAGGQHEVRGWVHAYRLNVEQANRARHKCRQGHKKPMVLVPDKLDNDTGILQTKFSDREGHEARRVGLKAVPLDQHIEGGHGEGQARLKIRPAPMHDLLQMADERQHREHRLNEHTILPLAPRTQCEIRRIALGSMEAHITQDNHPFLNLPNQPLKRVIRNIGRGTCPPHDQPPLIEQQTEFASDDPAVVRHAFTADLLRAPALPDGVDELDPIGVDDAEHGRCGQEDLWPVLMRPEEAKEARPLRESRKQRPIVARQPAIERPITHALERM